MRQVPSCPSQKKTIKRDDDYINAIMRSVSTPQIRRKNELLAIEDERDSIMNDSYATLYAVNVRAGAKGIAEALVIAHLHDFAEYCAFTEAVTEEQYIYLSRLIVKNYGYLKVRELLMFFTQLKSGKYERFYNRFDPMKITTSLEAFIKWRNAKCDEYEHEFHEEEYEAQRANAISLEQFLAEHPGEEYDNLRRLMKR